VLFQAVGSRPDEWDIWLWQPRAGTARALTGPEGDEQSPEVSGDRVVFTRGTGASPLFNRAIVVRALSTGEERVLSDGMDGFQTEPAIDGARVVWRQQTGSTAPSQVGLIWLFDLRTGERTRLDDDGVGYDPRIAGDLVCWSTLSGHAGGVRVLDLATGRRTTLSRDGHHCDVEARRVLWLEGAGVTDVYFRDLRPDEP
jgi:hypothetical protein